MKRFSNTARHAGTALSLSLMLLGTCHAAAADATLENFTGTITRYLAERGHVCLAKYEWPVYVTKQDQAAKTRDAVQMPVLEKLGLVKGLDTPVEGTDNDGKKIRAQARQYSLTEEGNKYYLHKPVVVATAGQQTTHPADFCVATLTLDKVVGWEPPVKQGDDTRTSVLYTYRIDPAPWTRDAEFQRVFPMVARLVESAGTLQLREGVRLTKDGWVAEELFKR
ncbi:Uncharacterised protein [Bordetella ansorpii]|uniref:Secreted protein n=1 Tax=Bordetella ansorpii TaxID=288768 RepID=A0A157S5E6_9BORD|nr:hypothetical protein [Bordetella ansorpii]SAI65605.1 Uncharacterised protein [Bordetella ansorpii]